MGLEGIHLSEITSASHPSAAILTPADHYHLPFLSFLPSSHPAFSCMRLPLGTCSCITSPTLPKTHARLRASSTKRTNGEKDRSSIRCRDRKMEKAGAMRSGRHFDFQSRRDRILEISWNRLEYHQHCAIDNRQWRVASTMFL